EPDLAVQRLHERLARRRPADTRHGKGPARERLVVPVRRVRAPDGLAHVVAVEASEPVGGKSDHGFPALGGKLATETASDLDRRDRRARYVGEQRGSLRAIRFFEHKFVLAEPERIADELKRDVVIAAELELAERLAMTGRQAWEELHIAGQQYVG